MIVIWIWGSRHHQKIKQQLIRQFKPPLKANEVINKSSIPPTFQRYINYCLIDDAAFSNATLVKIVQNGKIRLGNDSVWANFTSEQYFNLYHPEFLWFANISTNGLTIKGWDYLLNGKSNMTWKLFNTIKIVNEKSCFELNQGGLSRYLAEIPWIPFGHMLYGKQVQWINSDEESVTLEISHDDLKLKGKFYFNSLNQIIKFEASRFRKTEEGFSNDSWQGTYSEYQEIKGILVPTSCTVKWILPDKTLEYIQINIEDIIPITNEQKN